MDSTSISSRDMVIYGTLINAGIGLLLGLAPLIAGFLKRKVKLGILGFFGSLFGGAVFGIILSLPVSAVLTWLILRSPKTPTEVVVVNQDPIAVSMKEDQ